MDAAINKSESAESASVSVSDPSFGSFRVLLKRVDISTSRWKVVDTVPILPSYQNIFSYSTSLPLASTRYVWSAFSSHCPLPSKQCHWLTWAISTIFFSEMFWECWELNLGQLSQEQVRLPLCYAVLLNTQLIHQTLEVLTWTMCLWGLRDKNIFFEHKLFNSYEHSNISLKYSRW